MPKLRVKLKKYGRICPGTKYDYWRRNHRDWREIQIGGVAEIEVPDEKKFFEDNPGLEKTSADLTFKFEEATGAKPKKKESKDES